MSQSICSTGLRWLWLVVVVLIIDLGSKYLILQNFALGDTVPLFPSLNLHYARNYGAAFSFLADSGGWQRWFFAGIAIGISVILAVMMYRSKATQKLNNIAYALIIGGALGNLFDIFQFFICHSYSILPAKRPALACRALECIVSSRLRRRRFGLSILAVALLELQAATARARIVTSYFAFTGLRRQCSCGCRVVILMAKLLHLR